MLTEFGNPFNNLVSVITEGKPYDPKDPRQASAITQALLHLGFCGDTMNLLAGFIGGSGVPKDHTERWEAFFRAR